MKLREFLKDTFSVSKGAVKLDTKGVIEGYRERYDRLVADSSKKFTSYAYTVPPKGRVILHIKVPSETVDQLNYDVLLELAAEKSATDFRDCDVKIFSNCPSFVYTYAYVFAHWDPDSKEPNEKGKGMMIDALKGKLPRDRMMVPGSEKKLGREPVHEEPVTRNPMGIPMFDKSIYYAVFYMLDNLEFRTIMHNYHNVSMPQIFTNVEAFDKLMDKRKRLEAKQKVQKKDKEKKTAAAFEEHEKGLRKRNQAGVLQPKSPARAGAVQSMSQARTTSSLKSPTSTRKPKT